jgi:hypothetical protein
MLDPFVLYCCACYGVAVLLESEYEQPSLLLIALAPAVVPYVAITAFIEWLLE